MYYENERDRDELLIYFMSINDNTSQMFVWWKRLMPFMITKYVQFDDDNHSFYVYCTWKSYGCSTKEKIKFKIPHEIVLHR